MKAKKYFIFSLIIASAMLLNPANLSATKKADKKCDVGALVDGPCENKFLNKTVRITLSKNVKDPTFKNYFVFTGKVVRVQESRVLTKPFDTDGNNPTKAQADIYYLKVKFNGKERDLAVPKESIQKIEESAMEGMAGDPTDLDKFQTLLNGSEPLGP